MSDEALELSFCSSLSQVLAADWNALTSLAYPLLRHEFLLAMERSGATTAETGWEPCHALCRQNGALVALMPLYLKHHPYGEFVFDHLWADAWQRNGQHYYPKLLSAIPYSPVTGPRFAVDPSLDVTRVVAAMCQAVRELAAERSASSWHVLFPDDASRSLLTHQGLLHRRACNFRWHNEGWRDFDDYLAACTSRRRKNLRRERRLVREQGVCHKTRIGEEISSADWALFYRCYQQTYARHSGHGGYLSPAFFADLARSMPEALVMFIAEQSGEPIAAALCLRGEQALYGRYWGALRTVECLHFETCYYQGIDYCLREGLSSFDPGVQGDHKLSRGFLPVETSSCHWMADPSFHRAVGAFVAQEAKYVGQYREAATTMLPFRRGNSPSPHPAALAPEHSPNHGDIDAP